MTTRTSSRRRLAGLALVATLTVAACGSDSDDTPAAGSTSESTSESTPADTAGETPDAPASDGALPAGEYTIGFASLTSGPAAFAGVPLSQGANLAVQEANDAGLLGEGVTLKMVEEDAGGDAAKAIGIVEGFLNDDVSAVLCCALSSVAGSVKPILASAETAGIVTSAILPDLPELPYMYRTVLLLGDPAYTEMVTGLNADGAFSSAVIVVTADNDGMTNEGVFWEEAFGANDISVNETIDTATGDTDFSGPATQIVEENPDIVALSMLGQEATLLAKALRDRGYEGQMVTTYGISNAANYEIGGETLDGIIFPIAFTPQMESDAAKAFTALYEAEYGEVPDVFAAQGYVAVKFVMEGLAAAGTGDHAAVAAALAEIDMMDSPYGSMSFEGGQADLAGETTFMQWNADGTQSLWVP